jgi:SAM-dependent methyltransferase
MSRPCINPVWQADGVIRSFAQGLVDCPADYPRVNTLPDPPDYDREDSVSGGLRHLPASVPTLPPSAVALAPTQLSEVMPCAATHEAQALEWAGDRHATTPEMVPSMENDPAKIQYLREIREKFIDPTTSHPLYDLFLQFLKRNEKDPHYPRYAQTMSGLLNLRGDAIVASRNLSICETGGLSLIAKFFKEQGFLVHGTDSDLRYFIDAADNSFDMVLSLEVLEHIKDQRAECFNDIVLFSGSGARKYAEEISRILKKDGILLLTTPNPCSVLANNSPHGLSSADGIPPARPRIYETRNHGSLSEVDTCLPPHILFLFLFRRRAGAGAGFRTKDRLEPR